MFRKKILAVLLACFLCSMVAPPAVAASTPSPKENFETPIEPVIVMLRNEYTNRTSTNIDISGGTATASAYAYGYPDLATSVTIYLTLQRYIDGGWRAYDNWSDTSNSSSLAMERTCSVDEGYQYRVKASYYVYAGSDWENLIEYSQTETY